MNIKESEQEKIVLGELEIDVIRKEIKNMHLAVYPPTGRIRLAAPFYTDNEVLRLFAISKLPWIRKHVKKFQEQSRETPRIYVNGESHYYNGKRFLLKLDIQSKTNSVQIKGSKTLLLSVSNTSPEHKSKVMKEWYRAKLKELVPELLEKWMNVMELSNIDFAIKHMKTKWGSCNIEKRRIWLNLELAKKPTSSIEYIIVHELVHLFERKHNDRFIALMDKYMPNWRVFRDELNSLPVSHSDWGY